MSVRTRFAPSPTGYLHIGGVRTALFNWLFARQHGGQFVLRIDNTDQQRNVDEALQPILDGLRWLGIDWDEGPQVGGPFAPYYQSQRLDRYQAAVEKLLASGHAYYDYATPAELQAEREAAEREKRPFRYSRRFLAGTAAERAQFEAQGRQAVVRLMMPEQGTLVLDDLVRGRVEFPWTHEQDHVIQRADGTCLYHLANVVDDYDFEISHVIRAEEHLSNTPRQVFILEALGYPRPAYAHLPFVAEPGSRNKLSKRKLGKYLKNRDFAQMVEHGRKIAESIGHPVEADAFNPVIVDFYRTVGYLPEAIINYLSLLGWSLDDKTEHFSRQELIEKFSLERVNKAPASFDPKKLQAFEDWHFQQLPPEEKVLLVRPYLQKAGLLSENPTAAEQERVAAVVRAAGDRIKVAGDILEFEYFFQSNEAYSLDRHLLSRHIASRDDAERLRDCREEIRTSADDLQLKREIAKLVCARSDSTTTTLPSGYDLEQEIASHAEGYESAWSNALATESSYRDYVAENAIRMADIIHKVRVAITGKETGLGLFHSVDILGKKNSIARIDRALREAGFPEFAPPQFSTERVMQVPESLQEAIDFSAPANAIRLHEGHFELAFPNKVVAGPGQLEISLAPRPSFRFLVQPESPAARPDFGEARLSIPELDVSVSAIVTRFKTGSHMGTGIVEGVPNGRVVIGANSHISHVIFHITDFHDYIGKPVRDKNGTHLWAGRLTLSAGEWLITIDALANSDERRTIAARQGGTPVTHVGKLERRDGKSFLASKVDDVIESVQFFLSFVRGRWVAPLVLVGSDDQGNVVWRDWTLRRTGDAPVFGSWCPVHAIGPVESLFPHFFERWTDSVWRDFLRPAIGTYLQSNRQGLLDDTIIFAQILLEMVADFVLVEQSRMPPPDAREKSAENRIEQLLQRLAIPNEIPGQLADLRRFAEKEDWQSALATVASVRNACVHHNAKGRNLLRHLESAFYDTASLALWLSELCLLSLLGYEGRYQNRLHAKWVGETEAVPWNKPLKYPLEP